MSEKEYGEQDTAATERQEGELPTYVGATAPEYVGQRSGGEVQNQNVVPG